MTSRKHQPRPTRLERARASWSAVRDSVDGAIMFTGMILWVAGQYIPVEIQWHSTARFMG